MGCFYISKLLFTKFDIHMHCFETNFCITLPFVSCQHSNQANCSEDWMPNLSADKHSHVHALLPAPSGVSFGKQCKWCIHFSNKLLQKISFLLVVFDQPFGCELAYCPTCHNVITLLDHDSLTSKIPQNCTCGLSPHKKERSILISKSFPYT